MSSRGESGRRDIVGADSEALGVFAHKADRLECLQLLDREVNRRAAVVEYERADAVGRVLERDRLSLARVGDSVASAREDDDRGTLSGIGGLSADVGYVAAQRYSHASGRDVFGEKGHFLFPFVNLDFSVDIL